MKLVSTGLIFQHRVCFIHITHTTNAYEVVFWFCYHQVEYFYRNKKIFRKGRTKFLNRDRGQQPFKDRLSLENWAEIPDEEKLGQRAVDCKAFRKQPTISATTPNVPPPQIIIQHLDQHHHTNLIEPAMFLLKLGGFC